MAQKMKCKIAFLTHGDRNLGGGEQFLSYLVRKIDRTQFDPVVLCSKRNQVMDELAKEGVSVMTFDLSPKLTSVYRDQVRLQLLKNLVQGYYFARSVWKLRGYLKKNRIQILHAHD